MKNIVLIIALLFCIHTIQAQVIVTSGGNVDMCVGGAYKTIPDFKVAEKVNTDFNASTSLQTYELSAPNNFEFNPGVGSVVTPASTDISFAYLNVTATKITLNYFLNATAKKDSFIFKNIQVHAVGTTSSNDLRFTGGSASQNQNNTNQYVHAHFNSNQAYVNLNASQKVVCSSASDITLNGSPGGGSYSVSPSTSALSGSTFKPSVSGSGLFVVTYTASQNGCTGSDTVHITVTSAPAVTFFGLSSSYCSKDSSNIQLTGFPSGGVFTGNGTSGTNGSVFKPYTVAPTTNLVITYKYTSANGCQNSVQAQTNILESPSVTLLLKPNNLSYSIYDPGVEITGTQSNPSSGGVISLSGDGVSNSTGIFTPSAAGVGEHIITRSLKAPNGCITAATQKVTVTSSNSVYIIGLDNKYCNYNSPVNLTSAFPNATFSGQGIVPGSVDQANSKATFDPSQVIFDGQEITVFITVVVDILGTQFPYIQPTTIYKKPIVIISQDTARNSVNFKTKFCNQDPIVPLNVYVFPAGGAGTFSGPGINSTNFNPRLATPDVDNTITYSYTDNNGCQNIDTKTTHIYSVTDNLDFGLLESSYCSNSDTVTLNATKGGVYFTGGSFNGNGIKGDKFIPSLAASYNTGLANTYEIKYVYGNTAGCITTVSKNVIINKIPEVNLTLLNNAYCLNSNDVNLSGTPSTNGTGSFSITSLLSTTNLLVNNKFSVNKALPGTYYLTYTFKDQNTGCTNFDTDTTIIRSVPNTSFSNLNTAYCMSKSFVSLYGSPSGGTYSSTTAEVSNISQSLDIEKSGVNEHQITYTYTDEFGCTASSTQTTVIYGSPSPSTKGEIKLSTACEKDLITFSDYDTKAESKSGAQSYIKTANWKIDTTTYIKDFPDGPIIRLSEGKHSIIYTLTTDKGCSATFDSTVTIGSYPKTNFTWDKICNKENTKFYNTSSIVVGNIINLVWDFGDGKSANLNLPQYKGDTSHTFTNSFDDLPSTYSVILKATSDYNCVLSDTQKVFILPAQEITSSKPYSSDFELNNGGWIADAPIENLSSWKLGNANKPVIKSDNNVWVTSIDGSFNPKEISYVYSPCFTLKDITKPMIHLDIWSSMINNVAGANLQYAVDGTTWKTLGKRNESGVNWYNNTGNIVARPSGTDLDQNGWTDTNTVGWKNARHIFDKELGSSKNIRFRIAFAGTEETTDGFAFDNVWIGDRTRLILTEYFTNNSTTFTKAENVKLNDLVTSNLVNNEPKDIVKLEYHTAFPGPDQINARNIPDAGARSLYYGVTQVPYSCVDGSYFRGSAFQIDTNMINTRALYDPAFSLILDPKLVGNVVSGKVTIENKIKVKNNVTVYVSVLERFVNGVYGANNESSYQWVHAKFRPDAAGTSFNFAAVGDSRTVDFTWPFESNNIYNPEKIAVIAFVQDNVTKEIYQTAYKGLGATVSTGVFDPAESTSTVSLYPNPANNSTTVALNGKLNGTYNWLIVDEMGRVVDEGTLTDGTDGFTINTTNYTNGFYTLRLSNSNAGVKTQKFVVIH